MSRMVRIGVALVLVAVLALAVTGCQAAIKGAIEGATGAKIDQGNGSVTVTDPSGQTTTVGSKSLPDGMPADFPVYAGTLLTSGKTDTAQDTSFSFSMETADSAKTVADWYTAQLKNGSWTIDSSINEVGASVVTASIAVKKGKSEGGITVGEQDGKTTIISILTVTK
jgi:hypothetical protein